MKAIHDLSDDEIRARLNHWGVDQATIRLAVANRNNDQTRWPAYIARVDERVRNVRTS